MDKVSGKRRKKLGIEITQLFDRTDKLVKQYMQSVMEEDHPLQSEMNTLEQLFDQIAHRARQSDKSLKGYVEARQKRVEKMINNIENRIIKAEKDKKETAINQIEKMKNKLFPRQNLQERVENFSAWYLQFGDTFFEALRTHFDPFDAQFTIFEPEQ